MKSTIGRLLAVGAVAFSVANVQAPAQAQVAPSESEYAAYTGLHAAAAKGDIAVIGKSGGDRDKLNGRDGYGRTSLIVAAYARQHAAAKALIAAGANLDALDRDRYDVITITPAVPMDPRTRPRE
jgi:uncharacterized protein